MEEAEEGLRAKQCKAQVMIYVTGKITPTDGKLSNSVRPRGRGAEDDRMRWSQSWTRLSN